MILETLYLSIIALILTGGLYILGNCLLNLILWQNFRRLRNPFLSIYWGVLGLVVFASSIYSGFSTVFLLTAIPIFFLARYGLVAEPVSLKTVWFHMLFISILHFILALLLQIFPYGANVENDMPFYAQISEYLIVTGIENTNHHFNDLLISPTGNTVYHYFELWFNGFIGSQLGNSYTYLYLFKFLTLPLFISYCIAGTVQIIPTGQRMLSLVILFVVSCCVLITNFSPFINLGSPGWSISHHMFSRTIFIFYFFGILPAFLALYGQRNYLQFMGYILIIPLISATTAPAIYSGSFLFVVFLGIRRIISRKELFLLLGIIIVSALAFFIFYLITGVKSDEVKSGNFFSELADTAIALWKAIVFQITTLSLRSFLFALFPLILIYRVRKKIHPAFFILLLFALIISVSGILIFQAIPTVDNAYQIPYIGYTCISVVLAFAFVLTYQFAQFFGRLITVVLAFCLAIYTLIPRVVEVHLDEGIARNYLLQQGYTRENIDLVDSVLLEIHEPQFSAGFILTSPDAEDFAIRKPIVWQLGQELGMLRNGIALHPLTPPVDIMGNRDEWRNKSFDLKTLEFYHDENVSDWKAHTNAYIKKHDLKFIFSDGPVEGLDIPVYVIRPKILTY